MSRKLQPRYCACGCGGLSRQQWLPGHDQKLRAAIEHEVGGLIELRRIIEELLHRSIELKPEHYNRGYWQNHQNTQASTIARKVTHTGDYHDTENRNRAA